MKTRELRTYSVFILIAVLIIAGGERPLKGAKRSGPVWKSHFVPGFPFGGGTDSADARKDLVHGNQQSNVAGADLIIYGATPSGITAAIEAANLGHTVILLEPTQHVGGMMSNGLGSSDVYGTYSVGGIAAQFFQGVNSFYNGDPASAGGYHFEPHVAESIFNSMLAAQSNITVKLGVSLGSVSMNGTTIAYVLGNDGVTYQGIEYIDASYTGDLMAAAGVSYTVGRESFAEYKESGAGVGELVPPDASSIDPYIVPGDSSSGLIAHVSPDVLGTTGSADTGVMAYNYRLCLSSKANNEIPFSAPANYDSSEFEILKRLSQSGTPPSKLSDLLALSPLPNHKFDVNNSNVLSTDEIGESFGYPDGAPSARQSIETEQIRYERALLYFIANDPSVPSAVQSEAQALGLCKDEFTDNGGWPHQIYVREARRMLGTYVLTLADLEGKTSISDSIGLGGYPIDSQLVNLVSQNGQVEQEGAVENYLSGTYLIPYRILTPQASQVTNLLVPVAVSASHLAFDSLRVEVTYMIMGQAAGAAASIAISQGSTVQGVPHSALQAQLLNDGQVITIPPPSSLSLSATNIAFGTQSFGSYTNSQPVTLTNTGAATIFFTFITLEGGYGSSYLASNNCGASLAVGASCTVQLRFNPQIGVTPALAVVPASLAIYDNTLHSPQNVRLTGTPLAIPPTISWASPAAIAYGTTLSATQLDAASTVAGTFVYSPPAGTVLNTGSQTLTATFTPSDTTHYIPATSSVILTVSTATPVISWTSPAAITYGTALSGTQLNATSSVAGAFSYKPAAGTVLGAGVQTLTATFTPSDTTDYSTATVTTTLAVDGAIASLSPTSVAFGNQTYGSYSNVQTVTLSNSGVTALNITSIGLTGAYASSYLMAQNCPATLAASASCTIRLRFNPKIGITPAVTVIPASLTIADDALSSPQSVSLTGTPLAIPPTISWASPAAIAYGTTLSATQLDAASTVAGTFVYSPPAGTVLNTGSQTLTATFTPSDTTDYIPATASVILTVTRAFSTTALSVSSTSIIAGQSVTLTATVSDSSPGSTGTPTGTVSFYDNGAPLNATPVALTAGTAAYTTAILAPNTSNVITAVYSGDANFTGGKSTASNSTTIVVAALDFTMTISGPASGTVIPGQSIIYQVNVTPMYGSYASSVNFTVSGLPSGATATFSPSSIAANGGPQTIILTVLTAPASAAAQSPPPSSSGRRAAPLALALLGLLGLGELRKRRRAVKQFFCLLALLTGGAAATLLSGCGGSSGAQGPQNYAVTITATSGTLQHSIGVTLNVQ